MDKKLLLILNPCSGTRQGRKFLADIVALFADYNYISTVFITKGPGDGTKIVAEHGASYDLIVCIGGDGTFNEIVSGLMIKDLKTPVGYIPAGSTNDFASSLHISSNMITAAKDIMEGSPVYLDVGKFNNRYFAYVASFGAFTKTSYETPQNIKNALGHLAYILAGIKDISFIHPLHLKLEANDTIYEGDYLFGAISNSTSLGGVLSLNPSIVDMNDGIFETLLIKAPKNAGELVKILVALSNKQYDIDLLEFIKASKVTIWAASNIDWSLDGERGVGNPVINIENIHDAIQLVINDRHE